MQNIFRQLFIAALAPMTRGQVVIRVAGGDDLKFGGQVDGPVALIEVKNPDRFFRKCVLSGAIGFAEGFIDGDWTTADLVSVLSVFILNSDSVKALESEQGKRSPWLSALDFLDRWQHRLRRNTVANSRKNIHDHYDLGNEFFRLWLDETMTYSSAYFDPPESDLQAAQIRKYDLLCRKLQLGSGHHVLEIGTGWGGFAIHAAANFGCRVTTTTISQEQFREATKRIGEAGLSNRVTVLLSDYRTLTNSYDRVVSIEMIEAVGDEYLDEFLKICGDRLKPDGLLGIQMITCPDRQFKILRDGVDFIQKHIFPGSLLVSQGRISDGFQRTGWLNLFDWEDMGIHYARTLQLWSHRFASVLDEIRQLGFDESFIRKWKYYLAYCEAGFAMRHISVVQAVYSRPNNLSLRSLPYTPEYSVVERIYSSRFEAK